MNLLNILVPLMLMYFLVIEKVCLVNAETMAMKTMIIATDINGINDVVEDKKTGLLVKSRDYRDLKEKMQYSYDNFDELSYIVENAYNVVENEFEQNYIFDLMLKDRREILDYDKTN